MDSNTKTEILTYINALIAEYDKYVDEDGNIRENIVDKRTAEYCIKENKFCLISLVNRYTELRDYLQSLGISLDTHKDHDESLDLSDLCTDDEETQESITRGTAANSDENVLTPLDHRDNSDRNALTAMNNCDDNTLPLSEQALSCNSSNVKEYKCDKCDLTFIHRTKLKRYKATHKKENLYSCEICEKGFATKRTLRWDTLGGHGVHGSKKVSQNTKITCRIPFTKTPQ